MMMFDYLIDLDWLHRISFTLELFSQTGGSDGTFACRCPYCGDSKKSKKKKRLFFYTKRNSLNFDCKNCGAHGSFYRFMREQQPNYFDEYKRDQTIGALKRRSKRSNPPVSSNLSEKDSKPVETVLGASTVKGCVPLTSLPDDHPAMIYLRGRAFTDREISRLMFSEDFRVTAESISPEPLAEGFPKEPRIVIPFYSADGRRIELVQGRSLNPRSKLRYMTIKCSDEADKIYGKNEIDRTKTVYCVEGPLDALFVDNCLATCDSNLIRSDADVLIYDNQPRSKEIVELMEEAIDQGRSVVVWPVSPNKKIDINDMVIGGMTRDDVMQIITENTFSGVMAKLQLAKWKKV